MWPSSKPPMEKEALTHYETAGSNELQVPTQANEPVSGADANYPNKGTDLERKLVRKVDLRLVPVLGFMYACSLIDRTNLPNARVAGMDVSIGTNIGNRYTICVMLFFIPYIICEIPANLVLKSGVHPRLWLPTATLIFGSVMIAHAFVPNWYTLAGLRIPLGVFEAFLFPGCVFLISTYYPRYETQKRISAFYLMGASVSGFGNIIAYGFSTISPAADLLPWQWIFLGMGLLTVAAALLGYIFTPNFPAKASFLDPVEKQLLHDRINTDRRDFENEHLTARGVLKELASFKVWAMGLLFLGSTLPAYAYSYFFVLILRGFGYSTRDSQLLSAPPYIAAVIVGMISAYLSDRARMRGPFIIVGALVSAVGSIVLGYTTSTGARYFAAFLAIIGCQSNIPAIMSWSQNNVRGYTARAVASAVVVGGGGIGGIIASVAFQQKDAASGYRPGLWTAVSFQFLIIILTTCMMLYFRAQNRKATTEGRILENSPGFLYTL